MFTVISIMFFIYENVMLLYCIFIFITMYFINIYNGSS